MSDTYRAFIENKAALARGSGFSIDPSDVHPILKPHQRDAVVWAVAGGRRAIFMSFGLGETMIQLEIVRQVLAHLGAGHRGLIVVPLGVRQEFARDARLLGMETHFIRSALETPRPEVLSKGTRELPVTLTSTDLAEIAQQLARAFEEIEAEEAQQDQQKASMKERLAGIYARQRRLAGVLRRGIEYRQVEIRTEADYEAGLAREIRVDTLEVLSSRVLTERERQMTLAPAVAAAADSAKAVHSEAPEWERTE